MRTQPPSWTILSEGGGEKERASLASWVSLLHFVFVSPVVACRPFLPLVHISPAGFHYLLNVHLAVPVPSSNKTRDCREAGFPIATIVIWRLERAKNSEPRKEEEQQKLRGPPKLTLGIVHSLKSQTMPE